MRLEVDIYNGDDAVSYMLIFIGGDALSRMVRLEVDIYNGGYTLCHMARFEVDIYNGDNAV